jgi:putative transposase
MTEQLQDTLPLVALTPDQQLQAMKRYEVLQPHLEHGVPLTYLARQGDIALRTLERWLAHYRREGLAGLARHRRRDRGQQRGLPSKLKELIEGLALRKPPPTIALVHRQVQEVARRNEWPAPNYQRVYRIVKQLDPALITLAHEGSQIYRTPYDLLHRHEADQPNAIWQADHTLLDI